MSRLDHITVKGYKSIQSLEDFPLDNLNVLIGSNGAGKSNFISMFRLLNNIYHQNLQLYIQQQGGVDSLLHFGRKTTDNLYIKLSFGMNAYELKLLPTNDNRLIFDFEHTHFYGWGDYPHTRNLLGSGHSESVLSSHYSKISEYIKEGVESWNIYHFHDTSDTAKVKQAHPINDNFLLKNDAGNLASYLYLLKSKFNQDYQRIVENIKLVLPYFHDFVLRDNFGSIELEWLQRNKFDTPLKAHMLSDGSLRFICLMTLLLQPTELLPDTILIDEPELGLHPYAIAILADVIKQVSESKQLIVSTQSVELLNYFDSQNVIVVNQVDEKSEFKRLDPTELEGWLEDYTLGELWQSNLFGGRP